MNSFDVHMHTFHSYDSLMSPKQAVQKSLYMGLDCIIVTDHNTIRGAKKAQEFAKGKPIEVYIGAEIRTQYGDVIGLFLNDEIGSRDFDAVINDIRNQNGIVYIPHPYASYTNVSRISINQIDVIEAYNGRKSIHQNEKAIKLALKNGKPYLGGSDAHFDYEIGGVRNITADEVSTEESLRSVILNRDSKILVRPYSAQFIPRKKLEPYLIMTKNTDFIGIANRILSSIKNRTGMKKEKQV